MLIDLGTGTGHAVLRRARADPASLFIGVDADARSLADASRRAARPARKGGLPNALFVSESAERLPAALSGHADVVTVVLPWGSLLRALVTPDPAVLASITACLRPGGEIEMLLSESELPQGYRELGLEVIEVRPADVSDVARLSSGWGQRLGIPARQPGWIIRLHK